jgi:dynamin 1-like protein
MQEHRERTRKIVEQLIEAEQNYLFTTDTDYLTNRGGAFFGPKDPKEVHKVQDPNKVLANELRNRIDTYFNLVSRNVRDSVPKIIGTFLVRACQYELQFTLYDSINKHEALLNLLSEPESISMERTTLTKTLETLNKALRAIKKDPDLSKRIGIEEEIKPEKKKEAPRAGASDPRQAGPGAPVKR